MKLESMFMKLRSLLFASSKSQSLIVPLAAPAATNTSEESKLTESIPLVCPDRLCKEKDNLSKTRGTHCCICISYLELDMFATMQMIFFLLKKKKEGKTKDEELTRMALGLPMAQRLTL